VRPGRAALVGRGQPLPAARIVGEAEQVRDGAAERAGQVGQAAHGQAAAVLYRAEGLVGRAFEYSPNHGFTQSVIF
jgi:hypothetical protein